MTEDLINAASNSMFSPNGPTVNPTQAQQQQISQIQPRSTGGPAFPLHNHGAQTLGMHLSGMTLRDYFAAKALPECIGWGEPNEVCARAYQYADAMLKQRNQ